MPRYLRWIAAITTGMIVQIVFQIAFLAVAVGTGRKELTGVTAAVVTFGAGLVNVICALAINDWLTSRYPIERRRDKRFSTREFREDVEQTRSGDERHGTTADPKTPDPA